MKPLSHRLIDKIPLPAWLTGLLASALCFVGYFLLLLNAGVVQRTLNGEIPSIAMRAGLMAMVLVAYMPFAHWYLRSWTWQHLGELNQRFALEDQRRLPRELLMVPVGIFGCVVFVILFLIMPEAKNYLLQPWNWSLDYTVLVLAISLLGWWMGRCSYELVWCAWQIKTVSRRLTQRYQRVA
jgi:hypothetical protein